MSDRKRSREHREDRHERKKHREPEQEEDKYKNQTKKLVYEVQKIKHVETFYENPPPGLIKEWEDKPEDCIPEAPGNEDARNFLANAPTKGLWMPLGKEVKVMQCWRCKRYGHRTGDRECPFFIKGNQKLEQFRVDTKEDILKNVGNHAAAVPIHFYCMDTKPMQAHEDPMYDIIRENKRNEKETRIEQLRQLLQDTTSDSDSSSSSSHSHKKKKKKKKEKEKTKKEKKKQKKKKKKHKAKGSDDSDSD